MGWSAGSFTRTNGTYTGGTVWQDDQTNGFDIVASRHDEHDEDLADGIDACLNKDGSNSPSAQLSWLKSQYYGGTSAGSAAAQTITPSPAHTTYQTGELILFKPGYLSTGATTLNKNGLGAKTIKRLDGNDLLPGDLDTTRMAAVVYDGTNYVLLSSQDNRAVLRSTVFSSTNNSVVETTAFSYSVAANLLKPSASSTGRKIKATIPVLFTNTSGASTTLRIKGKFGAATFFDETFNIGFDVTAIPMLIELEICAANTSASAQSAIGHVQIQQHGALTGATSAQDHREYSDPAQDLTASNTFACTLQLGVASASIGFTVVNAFVELI